MKIKTKDLELLMKYIEKEKPETIDIHVDTFSVTFGFADAEHRDCVIRLFETSTNTTPELVKKMKLYTRIKETKKQGDGNE
jgi:hypothetical protein